MSLERREMMHANVVLLSLDGEPSKDRACAIFLYPATCLDELRELASMLQPRSVIHLHDPNAAGLRAWVMDCWRFEVRR